MARIPTISPGNTQISNPKLTTQSPQAMQTQTIGPGQGIETIGKAIENTANDAYAKLNKARSVAQTQQAKLIAAEDIAKINSKVLAKQDIKDWNDLSEFDSDFENIKSKTSNVFTNKEDAAAFDNALSLDLVSAQSQMRSELKKRWTREGQGRLVAQGEFNKGLYARGTDRALEDQLKTIDDFAKADIIYPEEAEKEKIKITNDYKRERMREVARTQGIDVAREGVEIGLYGDEREQMLQELVHMKTLQTKDEIQAKIDGRYTVLDLLSSGKEDLYNLSPGTQAIVDADPVLSEGITKATKMKSSYYGSEANEDYVTSVRKASEATNRDALSALTATEILSGKLTADKAGALIFYSAQKAKTLKLTEKELSPIGDETTEDAIKQARVDAGLNSINRWAKKVSADSSVHAKVVSKYLTGLQTGGAPYQLVDEAVRNANIELFPEMINFPKEGQMISDPMGRFSMAYPDGRVTSIGSPIVKATPKPKTGNSITRSAMAGEETSDEEDTFETAKEFK